MTVAWIIITAGSRGLVWRLLRRKSLRFMWPDTQIPRASVTEKTSCTLVCGGRGPKKGRPATSLASSRFGGLGSRFYPMRRRALLRCSRAHVRCGRREQSWVVQIAVEMDAGDGARCWWAAGCSFMGASRRAGRRQPFDLRPRASCSGPAQRRAAADREGSRGARGAESASLPSHRAPLPSAGWRLGPCAANLERPVRG